MAVSGAARQMEIPDIAKQLVQDLFPKEDYGKDRAQALHFLIARSQPTQTIQNFIQKKDATALSHRAINQLSPLDLCALMDNETIAQSLMDRGASCAEPDTHGRTPFHYAYLVHGEGSAIFKCFVQAAAKSNLTVEKILKGNDPKYVSVDKIDKLINPPKFADNDIVFRYRKGEKVVEGTAEEFTQMTGGAQYSNHIVATREDLLRDWLSNTSKPTDSSHQNALREAYAHFRQKPQPKLYLHKDEKFAEVPEVGFDVVADQVIEIGDIICICAGEQKGNPDPSSTNPYHVGKIDAQRVRNLGGMMNHGFPNVVLYTLFDVEGLSKVYVYIAIEKIRQGDKLCMNYGIMHSIVWSDYRVELREKQLRNFLEKGNPADIYKEICRKSRISKSTERSLKRLSANEASAAHLSYLFQDPYAFRFVLEQNKTDKDYLSKLQILLQDDKFRKMAEIDENSSYCGALQTLCNKTHEIGKIDEELFKDCLAELDQ